MCAVAVSRPGLLSGECGLRTVQSEQPELLLWGEESGAGGQGWTPLLRLPCNQMLADVPCFGGGGQERNMERGTELLLPKMLLQGKRVFIYMTGLSVLLIAVSNL